MKYLRIYNTISVRGHAGFDQEKYVSQNYKLYDSLKDLREDLKNFKNCEIYVLYKLNLIDEGSKL